MTAEQMFEKLGFDILYLQDRNIFVNDFENIVVIFWLEEERYEVCHNITNVSMYVSVKLHKAITKQMEELKWL